MYVVPFMSYDAGCVCTVGLPLSPLQLMCCVVVCCAGLVLVLARLCVHMETNTVPLAVELLGGAFQGSRSSSHSDGPPRFIGGQVARRLGTTASERLNSPC